MMTATDPALLAEINGETGKLEWTELQRHFARGVVLRLAAGHDLVEIAAAMARDDKTRVAAWLETGVLARADVEDAQRWEQTRPLFWAVVVAPWVLVQEIEGTAYGAALVKH